MTDNPKRVVIWAAVSSEEQATEKHVSIPDQLRFQQERARRNGWVIVDQIIIEGFSRRYYNYREFAEAAAEAGHRDPLRMFEHWLDADFEILSCRDLSRLGREQSILSEVIARTIDCGAVISPLEEAQLDVTNYRMISAIGGVGASEHIDKLKRWRNAGMIARAGRGETIGRKIPRFYVADENGKLRPDRERYQRLFDDMADLFLAGTSYEQFGALLAQRGHLNETTGKPYDKTVMKRLLIKARTWGHAEYNRTGVKRGVVEIPVELWATGRYDPPDNVFFKLDVFEPIWTRQQREDMIDELERRYNGIRGKSKPNDTYALTRICVCEECRRYMVVQIQRNPANTFCYVVCHHGRLTEFTDCSNNQAVRFELIQQYLDAYVASLQTGSPVILDDVPAVTRVPRIDTELERLLTRKNNLIDIISEAAVGSRADYQRKIDEITSQQITLQAERARVLISEREVAYTARQRSSALVTVAGRSLWDMPPTEANQLLRKLLGNRRVMCNGGDVTGLTVIGS